MDEFFGGLTFADDKWAILVPVALMSIDILTGLVNAWRRKNVKSSIMRQGLAKKFGEIVVLAIGHLFVVGIKMPGFIATVFSFYICLMETISIVENLVLLGVPIPKWLTSVLYDVRDKINKIDPKKAEEALRPKKDESEQKPEENGGEVDNVEQQEPSELDDYEG